jgi:hypothetical protein
MHCGSRIAGAVAWGQFRNPGRKMLAVGSWYQRTGEGQQTEKPKRVCSELQTVRTSDSARLCIAVKNYICPINPITNPNFHFLIVTVSLGCDNITFIKY